MDLVDKYGYDDMAAALGARDGYPNPEAHLTGGCDELDDFAACKITRKEDWIELYAKPYYFGCEADDRMNVCASTAPTRSGRSSTRSTARISGIST